MEVFDALELGTDALKPDVVDAVMVIQGGAFDAIAVAREIRSRYIGTVVVVEPRRAALLKEHLGIVMGQGPAFSAALSDVLSVAVQSTWAMQHATKTLVGEDDGDEETDTRVSAPLEPEVKDGPRPSVTMPHAPSADTLAAMALDDEDALRAPMIPFSGELDDLFSASVIDRRRSGARPLSPKDLSSEDPFVESMTEPDRTAPIPEPAAAEASDPDRTVPIDPPSPERPQTAVGPSSSRRLVMAAGVAVLLALAFALANALVR